MNLLKEINHEEQLNKNGKMIIREAVRGIILDNEKVLMIFSSKNGDYKFPGGGNKIGENKEETLIREVQEECGALVSKIEKGFGKVIEYNKPLKKEYDVFKMTSYYYICMVEENFCKQNLDQYEEELGFKPVWVDIDDAIQKNKLILNSNFGKIPRWTKRETFVLEFIKGKLVKNKIKN